MSLAALFLTHVPEDRVARFAAVPNLEAALAAIVESGRQAWPDVGIDAADFLAFLGRRLPADAASHLASLRAGDLYLVCAYGLGAPGAGPALEAHAMARVHKVLAQMRTPAATIADIQQELRERLVEMRVASEGAGADRAGYAGRGELSSWLSVSAVRAACRRRDRERREQPAEDADLEHLPASDADPEMAHLRRTSREAFQAAFRKALGTLTIRERNLLRYHFVEGLSIDQIGALYAVHRATAARWLERAREALRLKTRDLLAQHVSSSREGLERMLGLVESQISVRLDLAQA